MTLPYKDWLDKEYRLWGEALNRSTVLNFKEHPQVQRMLSEDIEWPEEFIPPMSVDTYELIKTIDNVGYGRPSGISDACWRMVYYAQQVLARKPTSIVEIGGGVGQFYAIMRALGYAGYYWISDLMEVQDFQLKYLKKITEVTGLHTEQVMPDGFDMCVSFYALGEFDDDLKEWYIKRIVNLCPRGFILWNPHSGASKRIPFEFDYRVKPEYPMLHPDCKQVEW